MSFAMRALLRTTATRVLTARPAVLRTNLVPKAFFSDSITYSGGQASEGQGGYYGSGGARADPENQDDHSEEERSKMLAMAADVEKITHIMQELETLESLLEREDSGQVSGRSIEIKNNIKKLMTSGEVSEALNRLTFDGSPVWGLSMAERALVELAKEKVNEC